MTVLCGVVVVAFGLFLVGLAVLAVVRPLAAATFLRSFASSARAHYTEQLLRLLAGAALVVFSASMWMPDLFWLFGWIIVVTAVALLLTPWRWHHEFGKWAIPLAIRHLWLFALGALALGSFVLYGASRAILS